MVLGLKVWKDCCSKILSLIVHQIYIFWSYSFVQFVLLDLLLGVSAAEWDWATPHSLPAGAEREAEELDRLHHLHDQRGCLQRSRGRPALTAHQRAHSASRWDSSQCKIHQSTTSALNAKPALGECSRCLIPLFSQSSLLERLLIFNWMDHIIWIAWGLWC